MTDFMVAGDDAGFLGLGQGGRKGIAVCDGMGGLHLGGGQNGALLWQHHPNWKRGQTVEEVHRPLVAVPFANECSRLRRHSSSSWMS
jgi:hypothetical protein